MFCNHCYITGTQFGAFTALSMSGLLASEFGWRSTFYFFGTTGLIVTILFGALCYDSPAYHPRITEVA